MWFWPWTNKLKGVRCNMQCHIYGQTWWLLTSLGQQVIGLIKQDMHACIECPSKKEFCLSHPIIGCVLWALVVSRRWPDTHTRSKETLSGPNKALTPPPSHAMKAANHGHCYTRRSVSWPEVALLTDCSIKKTANLGSTLHADPFLNWHLQTVS